MTATGNWNYNTSSSGDFPREARVLVVWKKYPKITISTPNGQVTSRNHWLIVEMHSSPRVCTGGTTCTVVPIIP